MKLFELPEIAHAVKIDHAATESIEYALAALGTGSVIQPGILSMNFPQQNGEVDIKTAWIHGSKNFAVKISTGFFNNHTYGLPSLSGIMIVFDAETGRAEAILADNGYLTAVRTALSGLIAAKYLARADSTRVAVIGSGEQARLQVRALKLLFPLEQVNVWSRNDDHAVEYAQEMQDAAPQVRAYEKIEDACRDVDIIVTTTPAIEPVLLAEHVSRGSHITAIGSDNEFKREISSELLTMVDIFCCDLQSQSESHGELKYFKNRHQETPWPVYEIGKIIAGEIACQRKPTDISLCCLSGTGVLDSAIAEYALSRL
ncbi:ectoine utilization protein EutC [Citrobacter amalonaticus Y19]|uniref:Ectoine utilization protein EutC n=1 Tax=Citrobacter amalonaticus Y19 TaxID=1261127 RepID=A0A0F6TVK2_CITAM|nr:ectoine utilization protein EutC [Citrobacter amalonaticus]AKE59392.1 ectoine utilization protein EutC [Citrobacter amalonaticus Y19]